MTVPHYAVLIGDVGQGKSTLVEKMTGIKGKSSNEDFSSTKESTLYYTPCRTLLLCDTPGTNPIRERLDHNMWIAHSLNTHPVSLILIVVKADTGRIDAVIDAVGKYAESFSSLIDNLGVCVTHMDKVTWTSDTFKNIVEEEFGIARVIFSDIKKDGKQLIQDISNVCEDAKTLCITSDNFLEYFKIPNYNIKVLRSVNREVAHFEVMKRGFETALSQCKGNEAVDLIFEFLAWIEEEMVQSQQRVATENNFSFLDLEDISYEAGHIVNLTNQLQLVLYDVRVRSKTFQNDPCLSDCRKCPYCGEIWENPLGYEGATTCGNRMSAALKAEYGQMANFNFQIVEGKLIIKETDINCFEEECQNIVKSEDFGCGATITWRNMTLVHLQDKLVSSNPAIVDDKKDDALATLYSEEDDDSNAKLKNERKCKKSNPGCFSWLNRLKKKRRKTKDKVTR